MAKMKLAISSLAWHDKEQPKALQVLGELNVPQIEAVPNRLIQQPDKLEEIQLARLGICAFQSLLFNTRDLALFSTENSRDALFSHIISLDEFAAKVGAKSLVLGSPRNRLIPDSMTSTEAEEVAIHFFRKLGDKISNQFCLEAVDVSYGCNFLRNTQELGDFIRKVNHPKIRMTLDLGVAIANQENLGKVIGNYRELFGHVHISELKLKTPGITNESLAYHTEYADLLRRHNINDGLVSIEMLRDEASALEDQLNSAVSFVKKIYRVEK